jgi:CheY-like chemotaxis protein
VEPAVERGEVHAQILPHVFERFRQADTSKDRAQGGLGLGLAIAKQIVELHGGTVSAQSPGEGKGATFTVSLPLAPVRRREGREHPAAASGRTLDGLKFDLSGVRILVVEDEADARHLLQRVLADCKADVRAAASATEALELMKAERFDVLVSDLGLPKIDGYQFMREVRRLSPEEGGSVPAIALTAFARSEDRTRAMMAGYQMHIAKPIEIHELLATVASFAGRTRPDE